MLLITEALIAKQCFSTLNMYKEFTAPQYHFLNKEYYKSNFTLLSLLETHVKSYEARTERCKAVHSHTLHATDGKAVLSWFLCQLSAFLCFLANCC